MKRNWKKTRKRMNTILLCFWTVFLKGKLGWKWLAFLNKNCILNSAIIMSKKANRFNILRIWMLPSIQDLLSDGWQHEESFFWVKREVGRRAGGGREFILAWRMYDNCKLYNRSLRYQQWKRTKNTWMTTLTIELWFSEVKQIMSTRLADNFLMLHRMA